MAYLDVKIRMPEGKISTDVYCKKTDIHQYLDYRPCHPGHAKRGISYGQALRLRRICYSEEVFEQRIEEHRGCLIKRGFRGNV